MRHSLYLSLSVRVFVEGEREGCHSLSLSFTGRTNEEHTQREATKRLSPSTPDTNPCNSLSIHSQLLQTWTTVILRPLSPGDVINGLVFRGTVIMAPLFRGFRPCYHRTPPNRLQKEQWQQREKESTSRMSYNPIQISFSSSHK